MANSVGFGFSPSATGRSCWSVGGIPFNGQFTAGIGYDAKTAGGGLPGYMPQPIIGHRNDESFSKMRTTLREVWNTNRYVINKKQRMITPFRAVMNAGDTLSRENYSCGGQSQAPQFIANVRGIKGSVGGTSSTCIPSSYYSFLQLDASVPAATCNVKYVYDSSAYTTYLKQQALNYNYNDRSFGGDQSSASQTAWRSSRRF